MDQNETPQVEELGHEIESQSSSIPIGIVESNEIQQSNINVSTSLIKNENESSFENTNENEELKVITNENTNENEDLNENANENTNENINENEDLKVNTNENINEDEDLKENSELLTDTELKERYNNKFEFNEAIKINPDATKQFLFYTSKRFLLGKIKPEWTKSTNEIFQLAKDGKSDYEIYSFMRILQANTINLTGKVKEDKLRSEEKIKYLATIDNKIRKLREYLKKHNIRYGSNGEIVKILDIGTEKLDFLDSLYENMYLRYVKGSVHGINIDDGFCHYDTELFQTNSKDTRFKLYDGKVIPFENNEMDLLTIFSVIHHIPNEDFKEVAKDIARVCKKLLFIKDVDMSDKVENIFFRLQHYLYEGILTPGKTSYLNCDVTMQKTLNILENVGFEVLENKKVDNFNGTYFALLKKKDYQFPRNNYNESTKQFSDNKRKRGDEYIEQGNKRQKKNYEHENYTEQGQRNDIYQNEGHPRNNYNHNQRNNYNHNQRNNYNHNQRNHYNHNQRNHYNRNQRNNYTNDRNDNFEFNPKNR